MRSLECVVAEVGEALTAHALTLVSAESCTGGAVAGALTSVPGSSVWFERGFVAYSSAAKEQMLGVSPVTLRVHGSVSEATVREMALGALKRSPAEVCVALSGVAGPGGGTRDKPVGTVWLAFAMRGADVRCELAHFAGDRGTIRRHSVRSALEGILALVSARS